MDWVATESVKKNPPPTLSQDQLRTLEVFRELWRYAPVDHKKERARLKKIAAEQKQFGRVKALAEEIPTQLSPDEKQWLIRYIKAIPTYSSASKSTGRPKRSERDEKFAYDLHTVLMANPYFASLIGVESSDDADDFIGVTMYASRRTAQRYRSAHAKKLCKAGDRKPKK